MQYTPDGRAAEAPPPAPAGLEDDASADRIAFSGEERGTAGERKKSAREVSIPVSEEQLRVEKRKRKTGEVRVSKNVITEEKQVNVPVTREEVRVERVPSGRQASESDARFAREDVSVPVMEEEVVVSKRPVVREEVRIRTEAHQEQRPVSASVIPSAKYS